MNKCKTCGANCDKEYCWRHKPKIPIKSSPIKSNTRLKSKPKTEKQKEEIKERRVKDTEFYMGIWDSLQDRKCWSCGEYLGPEPKTYMFDHLIEKSSHNELRYEKENIFVCCLLCHDMKSRGLPSKKHEEAIKKAKEKFGIT